MKLRSLHFFILLVFFAFPAAAQDSPQRDPASLASRYLGYSESAYIPLLPEPYDPGVTTSQFWVPKQGESLPQQVNAVLASGAQVSAELPGVLIWVEDGIAYDNAAVDNLAQSITSIFATLSLHSTYADPIQLPGGTLLVDRTVLMPVPDVDQDGFIHVLFTRDLADERDAIINPMDQLPPALSPGQYGNSREVIYVNTSQYLQAAFDDPIYVNAIASAYMHLLFNSSSSEQAPWLRSLMITEVIRRLARSTISPERVRSYLDVPSTPIMRTPTSVNSIEVTGGQQLFLAYLRQRFGVLVVTGLFEHAIEGLAALDSAIARTGILDPVTGAPPTGREVFADFAAANIVNALFGDGRFAYTDAALAQGQVAAANEIGLDDLQTASIMPYGVAYYFYTAPEARTIEMQFSGAQTTSRFPGASADEANRVYLASQLSDTDSSMTRSIDLTGVDSAALTFDALYDLSPGWNYGYVSVSSDGGKTWEALSVEDAEYLNPHGAAYGPGFTGVSNPEDPRPFPVMSIVLGADGVTIVDLAPDGPAQQAGIQANDVLIGVEGELWQTAPDILDVLAEYTPGQTVVFNVQRGAQRLELPVTLGAHPVRMVMPESEWIPYTVDLTPYAGQEILLRFELVTLPAYEGMTFALDNLAIEAIGWQDDGTSSDDWALSGWSSVSEQVPAEWLLTAVHTGDLNDHPPRVEHLLLGDGVNSNLQVALGANENLVLVVSALNTNTAQPADFELLLTPAE